ncbi:hypothetical protein K445DRAFT_20278 [Daldinia sp. EC12]|nr:hypothetical protein K445DRAFT_20278 [Daldinia sp. EC12]
MSTTTWNIVYLGLVAYLGQAATEGHIHIISRSRLRLLPRIIPGPQLTSTFRSFHVIKWELDASETPTGFPACASSLDGSFRREKIDLIKEFMNSPENNIPLSLNIWKVKFHYKDQTDVKETYEEHKTAKNDDISKTLRSTTWWVICAFWGKVQSCQKTDWIIALSFCATFGLFLFASWVEDGPAVVALVIISLHSMILSQSLRDQLLFQIMNYNNSTIPIYDGIPFQLRVIPGMVVRTSKNAFWIIECDFHTTLALFGARTRIAYGESGVQHPSWNYGYKPKLWKMVHPISNSMLLLSIVFLANSTISLQVAIASVYILVTFLFWVIPPSEPSEYKITKLFYPRCDNAHLPKEDLRSSEVEPSLARTLWYAIRITKSTGWVRGVKAAPETPGWDEWLREAELNMNNDTWHAEAEKRRLVDGDQHVYDLPAEQDASQERISEEEVVPVDESFW